MTETPDWSKTDGPSAPPPGPPPSAYSYPPGPYPGSYPPPPMMPYGNYPGVPVAPRNGLGIAALIIGVIALLSSPSMAGGIVLGVAAVAFGFAGRARVKRGEANNGGVAMAGIVIGVIAIIAGLAFVAFWVGLFKDVGAGSYFDCLQQAGNDKVKVQQCSDEFRESVENKFSVTATPTP